ncbi:hypothetical protein [Nocardia nepalensis]|uniref:hypothetical protein n=1 Tax=Nocardia nepalensis TaxID=3375448 RepID=UPI003B686150
MDTWSLDYTFTEPFPWPTPATPARDLRPCDRWPDDRRVSSVVPDALRPGRVQVLFTNHTWVEVAADLPIATPGLVHTELPVELVPPVEVIAAAMRIASDQNMVGIGDLRPEDWVRARQMVEGYQHTAED